MEGPVPRYEWMKYVQRAKKVVSNSPGLVNIVLDLPKGLVKFFEEFKLQKNCVINPARQKVF